MKHCFFIGLFLSLSFHLGAMTKTKDNSVAPKSAKIMHEKKLRKAVRYLLAKKRGSNASRLRDYGYDEEIISQAVRIAADVSNLNKFFSPKEDKTYLLISRGYDQMAINFFYGNNGKKKAAKKSDLKEIIEYDHMVEFVDCSVFGYFLRLLFSK